MLDLECSDQELVDRVVVNEQLEAFGLLFDRYHQQVYNKTLVFVELNATADNLTHDIFLKAFIRLKAFDYNTKFSNWLYTIAYRMCLEYARTHFHQNRIAQWEFRAIEQNRLKVFHCDSEQRLLNLSVKELRQVLLKLPPEDRLILLMRYQDEMSLDQIWHQLQPTNESISRLVDRARERAIAVYDNLLNPDQAYEYPIYQQPVSTA